MTYRTLIQLVAVLLITSYSAAAPLQPNFNSENRVLTLTGPERIHYKLDPSSGTLLVAGASITEGIVLPEGFLAEQFGEDLRITFPAGYGVSLSATNTALYLSPLQPSAQVIDDRAPMFVAVNHGNPSQIAGWLMSMYPNLRIQVDDRQRQLMIMAAPQDRELILKVIAKMDVVRPQVMFEAEILEINQGASAQLGIKYDDLFTFKFTESDSGNLTRLGKFSRNSLSLTLGISALKSNNVAKVLAQPRVTTMDGVEARINSTQTQPVVLSSQNGSQSVTNITTGISLRFLPRVSTDGTIEADLNIVVSVPTGMVNGVTTYSSRDASTRVTVKNGEPIVIGGLLESRTLNSTSKVPLLGDIPIIGELFTHNTSQTSTSDLMIVVTPRIIASPDLR